MTRDDILAEMAGIFRDIKPDTDCMGQAGLIDHWVLDSFDIIALVQELNDRFSIVIDADDIDPAHFNSAAAIAELVLRKLQDRLAV